MITRLQYYESCTYLVAGALFTIVYVCAMLWGKRKIWKKDEINMVTGDPMPAKVDESCLEFFVAASIAGGIVHIIIAIAYCSHIPRILEYWSQ